MQSGKQEPAGGERRATAGEAAEVNAEPKRKPSPSANRQAASPKETTRPWAVRHADTPSWVEKIEAF